MPVLLQVNPSSLITHLGIAKCSQATCRVTDVDIRTTSAQCANDRGLSSAAGVHQRRAAVLPRGIHVSIVIDEQGDHGFAVCKMQRSRAAAL
mmetsp:Transcript_24964/g.53935  ORF Transcript_24964/g.53935 Transcript_24964/m.53935 type:complete len:92 (-) Transcript_24964:1076-1351(-)